jgi:hypothetical protein
MIALDGRKFAANGVDRFAAADQIDRFAVADENFAPAIASWR